MEMNVLLIEHDQTVAQLLRYNLMKQGYKVKIVSRNDEAIREALGNKYDFILFDLKCPNLRGLRLLKTLRMKGMLTPIMILSSTCLENVVVQAFRAGADDFLKKPFNINELFARMKTILKRFKKNVLCQWITDFNDKEFIIGKINVYPEKLEVRIAGEELNLSKKEFEILFFLLQNREKVITTQGLINMVFKGRGTPVMMSQYINSIRKQKNTFNKYFEIRTIRLKGYMLVIGREISKES